MNRIDQKIYEEYLAEVDYSSFSGGSDYARYIISAYAYYRSRLLVPGRCYEDDNHGMLAVGGSAHLDIIDLDIWLSKQNDQSIREAIDWARGSSLGEVSYWRGLGRSSASTIKRRRDKIASKLGKNGKNAKNGTS